jgi:hypothetical protein
MTSLAMLFGGIGWLELLALTLLGLGAFAVLGLVIFFAVKLGSRSK